MNSTPYHIRFNTNRYTKVRDDLVGRTVVLNNETRAEIIGTTNSAYLLKFEDGSTTHMTAEHFTIVK